MMDGALTELQREQMVSILLELTLLMEKNDMTVEQVMALWPSPKADATLPPHGG